MAITYKRLGALAPSVGVNVTIYTVPPDTSAVISSIIICNRIDTSTSFRLAVVETDLTDSDYIYCDLPIQGNDTFIATIGLTLSAGDQIVFYAAGLGLSCSVFGSEVTA